MLTAIFAVGGADEQLVEGRRVDGASVDAGELVDAGLAVELVEGRRTNQRTKGLKGDP